MADLGTRFTMTEKLEDLFGITHIHTAILE